MKPPNRLGIYTDVRQILDAALAAGGGSYTCLTHGAAVHWRQRAYKFRKLYAEVLGAKQHSVYDTLTMPRIIDGDTTVHILIRQQAGIFKPNDGTSAAVLDIDTGDDLFEEAMALAKKLTGE